MAADFKLTLADIYDILGDINFKHTGKKKRNILIIGGAALAIEKINTRNTTQDIDCFELFLEHPTWIKKITSVIKNDQELTLLVNSDALTPTEELFQYVHEYVEVLKDKYINLRIFIPTTETFIALKLLSFYDSHKNPDRKTRYKDLDDIKSLMNNKEYDLSKIEVLLNKTFSKKYNNKYYGNNWNDYLYIFDLVKKR